MDATRLFLLALCLAAVVTEAFFFVPFEALPGPRVVTVSGWGASGTGGERRGLNGEQTQLAATPQELGKAEQPPRDAADGAGAGERYTPRLANGESLTVGAEYLKVMEDKGLEAAAKTAFVLVAGGLKERLGYDGTTLALPVERYLELYCKHILALQAKCGRLPGASKDLTLPLVILTSEDTDLETRELVHREGRFGMAEGQIIIVIQDKVPALDGLSEEDPFESKYHLLVGEAVAEDLQRRGFQWMFVLQDTNALVLDSLLPALGASLTKGYDMNSICVPRKTKEAAGETTALTREDGCSLIFDVEYDQSGNNPVLWATMSREGDWTDPETGLSIFPGITNNFVLKLGSYLKVLKGKGMDVVAEFVGPDYTRLEFMMRDFPKFMAKELGDSAKIGFTSFDEWFTLSPNMNDLESAAKSAADGVPPITASSVEFDHYAKGIRRLQTVE